MFSAESGKAGIGRYIAEGRRQLKFNQQMIRAAEQNPKWKGGETMLNQCTLTGNLGGDPEVFYSSEGNPVASFSLAFHSSKKKTGRIKVVCFQKLAEVSQKYLHKGARIAVIGTLDNHKWETDEGIQRASFQLLANTLEFIKTDGRGFEEGKTEDDIPL